MTNTLCYVGGVYKTNKVSFNQNLIYVSVVQNFLKKCANLYSDFLNILDIYEK